MGENKQDLSSFMSVLIMTIGALTILLVANTVIIASNPDNLQITSIFVADDSGEAGDSSNVYFSNKSKEPTYLDVYEDYLVIYPGEEVVAASDIDRPGNAFIQRLNEIKANREREYFVLVLRPGAAIFGRRMRELIMANQLDIGEDLWPMERKLNYRQADEGEKVSGEPGSAEGGPPEGEGEAAEDEAAGEAATEAQQG